MPRNKYRVTGRFWYGYANETTKSNRGWSKRLNGLKFEYETLSGPFQREGLSKDINRKIPTGGAEGIEVKKQGMFWGVEILSPRNGVGKLFSEGREKLFGRGKYNVRLK